MIRDDDVELMLAETAESLFRSHCSADDRRAVPDGGWSPALWAAVERAELPLIGVPETLGGAGGTLVHWAIVIHIAARHAAPVPLAETSIAGWLLGAVGLPLANGPMTVARASLDGDGRAVASAVPFGRWADRIAVTLSDSGRSRIGTLEPAACHITPGVNLAGEPRDDLSFAVDDLHDVRSASKEIGSALELRLTLARTLQIAGAAEAVRDLTITHARDRFQFGVALGRMPVVRDRLAVLAEEVAAAGASANVAVDALAGRGDGRLAVAAAKARAGEAAGVVCRIAHQLHGAVGMTKEHDLHRFTGRLWSWRDEEGNDRNCAIAVGLMLARPGAAGFWRLLVEPDLCAAAERAET